MTKKELVALLSGVDDKAGVYVGDANGMFWEIESFNYDISNQRLMLVPEN